MKRKAVTASRRLFIPGMTFGQRQALAHYAKQAGMSPEEMVLDCVTESAWEIALFATWKRQDDAAKRKDRSSHIIVNK